MLELKRSVIFMPSNWKEIIGFLWGFCLGNYSYNIEKHIRKKYELLYNDFWMAGLGEGARAPPLS